MCRCKWYPDGGTEEQDHVDSDESSDDDDCIFAGVSHDSEEDNFQKVILW